MRRRAFVLFSSSAFCAVMTGCATIKDGMNAEYIPPSQRGNASAAAPGGRRRSRGPSNIKDLSAALQRAKCPLTDGQIDFLQTLKEGPEFTQRMSEVLDAKQIEAAASAGGGRGGGGGGRRRR